MAVTTSLRGLDQLKGPYSGNPLAAPLHVIRIPVNVNGTYATAAKPNFNVLAALQNSHEGITAVNVISVVAYGDYYDGTNTWTASNANIALASVNSGSTNDKVTFRIDSGASNGATGTEIPDTTAVSGDFGFLVVCTLTSGSVGIV